MIKRLLIGTAGALILYSCATDKTGLSETHRNKNIKLNSLVGVIKIGYETDSAIIYLAQLDAIRISEKILKSKEVSPGTDLQLIHDLKDGLDSLKRINENILVANLQFQKDSFNIKSYEFSGFIDQWILRPLILNHKVEVWNKSTNLFEKKITYHFVEDQMGTQTCYYTFENGTEFHRQIIAIGE